ncbi:ABC transporter ATP-binding protein [Lactococcus lactis]|uniref:ABC transporter ATP-binding protein n=1 Tax=Lactococcus lactis TaxID=1358 RepID=UPI0021A74785|nr:ABC transporter ATP-binding protein [Lactococcus lactis]MCT3136138.1 ATP-binding cassette domain-containing protein [Lactococcus lactis]
MEALISFKDFTFKYDLQKNPTLKKINLEIFPGEKVLIVGPSGSGKSTIGSCLNGILPHLHKGEASGELSIAGLPFGTSIAELSEKVSTILQDTDGQFIGLSVAEDIAFALENDGLIHDELVSKVAYWSDKTETNKLLNHRPQDLSGGQKQRVSLAGVLIDESPILLFDEPLANLDPQTCLETMALIKDIHENNEVTTIIIEHRIEEVLPLGIDKIVVVNDGEIVATGSPAELLKTEIFNENSLREPLYLSALKAANATKLLTDFSDLKSLEVLSAKKLLTDFLDTYKFIDKAVSKNNILSVKNLSVNFAQHEVLKGINLEVQEGEKISIVGKNGVGKSTFANALCHFVEASGEILYRGQSIIADSISERAKKIGYIMQNPNLMISQNIVSDEVAAGLRLRHVDEKMIQDKVEEILKVCGLYPFRNWPISSLSYGQKKRVTIASILILEPEILVLDEPTAAQDLQSYREIMDFLDELNRRLHLTMIMITHDMYLITEYSDRTLVFADGKIIADSSPYQILENEDFVKMGNLSQPSLYQLARQTDTNPVLLTKAFINFQNQERLKHE